MDEPVPEIKVPILKLMQFTGKDKVAPLKSLADKVAKPIIKKYKQIRRLVVFICSRTS